MLTMNAPATGGTSTQPRLAGRLPRVALAGPAARLGQQQCQHPGISVRTTPCEVAARAGYRMILIKVAGASANAGSNTSGAAPSDAAQCRSSVRATEDSAASHSSTIRGNSGSAAGH